jgi:DNA polymerase-3 subunit delta
MKVATGSAEKCLRAPPPAVRAVLLYGPDAGLVRERADALVRLVAGDLADPFRVAEIAASALRDDPARLADEAAAMALTGGRRAVRVRDAADSLAGVFESFLADAAGDALVVVEAGNLPTRGKLRALFEAAGNTAAIGCYADDGRALQAVVRETLAARRIRVTADAMAYLLANLGADRMVSRAELEKLALYVGDGGEATLADAVATVGDSAAMTLEDLAFAAAGGDLAGLSRALDRVWREGAAPVAVLRSCARHMQRLHRAAGEIAEGRPVEAAMKTLKPPVFFKQNDAFRAQLRHWPSAALGAALARLTEAEVQCKTTGLPAEAVCAQALTRLCAEARARQR